MLAGRAAEPGTPEQALDHPSEPRTRQFLNLFAQTGHA